MKDELSFKKVFERWVHAVWIAEGQEKLYTQKKIKFKKRNSNLLNTQKSLVEK